MWEIFLLKDRAENEKGRLVLDVFLFFKKTLYKWKQMAGALFSIYFGRLRLRQTKRVFNVAYVVNIKLGFMDWFFYNLVILIKQWKIKY